MKYKQIRSKKIYEEVAEALKSLIESGELQPGDRLDSVERLAQQFDVGRSAIREALSALRAMGLVDIRHGEGTFVKTFNRVSLTIPVSSPLLKNPKDIQELLEVRKILEVGSARSAATGWEVKDLKEMEKALKQMNINMDDEKLGEEADWQFHLAIARATHNEMLQNLLNGAKDLTIQTMLETRRIWLYSEKVRAERLYEEHYRIFEAIQERDASLASQLMFEHLESVERIITDFYQNQQK
ncbi:GntR family transcriptional repressor for pyruvate dehydrogenase complex [Geomicrobium halophilum]|uniref:GntR family transcriptional repressor for pyruvate dehydrogenase complex n=1 Tax=Geomicrobium halophilum TaxID=549000 RepID=A0A841PMH9_9BACL|nr:FadR/GntR family transcriptional regulator [Geomicrobium halophilum]MBB6449960.1 GntR family transcriptional repressor for pyruvate dehydrogenase complex [Geomicrobium halophilum]